MDMREEAQDAGAAHSTPVGRRDELKLGAASFVTSASDAASEAEQPEVFFQAMRTSFKTLRT